MRLFILTAFVFLFIALPLYVYTQMLVPALAYVQDGYGRSELVAASTVR